MKNILKRNIKKLRYIIPNIILRNIQENVIYKPIIKQRNYKYGAPTQIFKAIFLELRSRCNSTCSFCPVSIGNDIRDDITMDFKLYKNIINQLKEINYRGRINFYNNSEPLITKNLFEYLEYATKTIKNGNEFRVMTNGISLNKSKSENLVKSGINSIIVNLYLDDLTKDFPEKVMYLKELVDANNIEKNTKISLNIYKRLITEVLCNKSGDAPNKHEAYPMYFRGFCIQPFTRLVIDPNGVIGLCCMDAFVKKSFGNLNDSKLIDIWEGSKLNHYRNELLQGNRSKLDVCSNCDYYGCGSSFNSMFKKIVYEITQ